jgi:hypothetical protein
LSRFRKKIRAKNTKIRRKYTVPPRTTLPAGREREIFEVLLSNPLVGAKEALALLGTCTTARDVDCAASLDAIRNIHVTPQEYFIPLTFELDPEI